jgi:hypothetical protein
VWDKDFEMWKKVGLKFESWIGGRTDQPYDGRNYELFGVLAGVREGNMPMIDPDGPRGTPDDLSAELQHSVDRWGDDGHSHTWYTLKELKEFDWGTKGVVEGMVDFDTYKEYHKTGKVTSWCRGVGGGKTKIVSEKEMQELITKRKSRKFDYYCHIKWYPKAAEYCQGFVEGTLVEMEKVATEYGVDHDHIRFVCWFDN